TVQRPSLDVDELVAETLTFKGVFDVEEVRVDGTDPTGAIGEGRLSHVLVSEVNLAQCELGPLELFDVRLENVELSNCSWQQVRAQRTEFLRCRGLGWRVGFYQIIDVYLVGCQFDYAVIRVDKVKGLLVFDDCSFREAMISGDLSNVIFSDCMLDAAEFDASKAKGCDLRGSQIAGTRGLLTLRGAMVDEQQAASAARAIASEAGLVVVTSRYV
ncbi:MAG: pentapeptide repeat-containing protein, partial [Pseudonocardiaceae bacterium]